MTYLRTSTRQCTTPQTFLFCRFLCREAVGWMMASRAFPAAPPTAACSYVSQTSMTWTTSWRSWCAPEPQLAPQCPHSAIPMFSMENEYNVFSFFKQTNKYFIYFYTKDCYIKYIYIYNKRKLPDTFSL